MQIPAQFGIARNPGATGAEAGPWVLSADRWWVPDASDRQPLAPGNAEVHRLFLSHRIFRMVGS
jgi:hypothetical protein